MAGFAVRGLYIQHCILLLHHTTLWAAHAASKYTAAKPGASITSQTWVGSTPFPVPSHSLPFPPFPIPSPPFLSPYPSIPSPSFPHPQKIYLGLWRSTPQRNPRGRALAANASACIFGWKIAAGGDDFLSWWSEINVYKWSHISIWQRYIKSFKQKSCTLPKTWSGPSMGGPYRQHKWSGPGPRSGWKSTPLGKAI